MEYPENLSRHKFLPKYIDAYLKLLGDSNSKVACYAINGFRDIL